MIAVMQPDFVRRHRLTVEEYCRMAKVGLLAPGARVELIDGEIIDMAPTGSRHAGLTAQLHRWMLRDLGERVCVWNQSTLPLSQFSAPEPDLVLLTHRSDEYKGSPPPCADDVLLIAEISESSLRHDQKVKLPMYAQHGIPEVWIVDVTGRCIHFYRSPEAGRYLQESSAVAPGEMALHALPAATVNLTGLLEDL